MRVMQTYVDIVVKNNVPTQSYNNGKQGNYLYKRIINFVICDTCYWSASYLQLDRSVVRCPCCNDDRLEFIPLSENEGYTFDCNAKRGVILGFYDISRKGGTY